MRIKPIESINELLKNDTPYLLEFHPVIVGRSTRERFAARVRRIIVALIAFAR